MPLGEPLRLTGLLLQDGATLVLRIDDGGIWRVEGGKAVWRLIGRRVCLTGTRDEFDLVAVRSIAIASLR